MRWLLLFALLVGCGAPPTPTVSAPPRPGAPPPPPPPAPAPRPPAAAVTDATAATKVAIDILEAGGNAIDAAVAATFVLGVVHPHASGLGGGGYALVWRHTEAAAAVFDFREEAPGRALRPQALGERPLAEAGVAVGVPGEVAGMAALHRAGGALTWDRVLQPAIALARDGFEVDEALAEAVRWRKSTLPRSLTRLFLDEGGDAITSTVRRPRLARTLARIAADGPNVFYREVGQALVRAAAAEGSTLTDGDLASYRVRSAEPLETRRGGRRLLTVPPSSSGGFVLAETWGMHPTALTDDGPTLHHFAEAVRAARDDARRHLLGDTPAPDAAALVTEERLLRRANDLLVDRTTPPPKAAPPPGGTSGVVVVDGAGDAVVVASSLGAPFGSEIAAEGVVLNAALLAFAREPDRRRGGARDLPRPGARPLSPLAPALLLEGDVVRAMATASGGEHAATALAQVLVRVEGGIAPAQAIALPRARVPLTGGLWLERSERWRPETLDDLTRRGELVRFEPPDPSGVLAIARGPRGGWLAAADPRKGGAAAMR